MQCVCFQKSPVEVHVSDWLGCSDKTHRSCSVDPPLHLALVAVQTEATESGGSVCCDRVEYLP